MVAAFGKGLAEVGYTEGKNLSVDYRFAEGALDRLPEMAAELVRRPLNDVIEGSFVAGIGARPAVRRAESWHRHRQNCRIPCGRGRFSRSGLRTAKPITVMHNVCVRRTGRRVRNENESFPQEVIGCINQSTAQV